MFLNLSYAIRFAVKQLIGDGNNEGLIPKIYNEPGRILRIIGDDDSEEMIGIGSKDEDVDPKMLEQDDFAGVYDLGLGLYDVVADVGQAFGSQRQEAFNSLMQVIQSQPRSSQDNRRYRIQIRRHPWGNGVVEAV